MKKLFYTALFLMHCMIFAPTVDETHLLFPFVPLAAKVWGNDQATYQDVLGVLKLNLDAIRDYLESSNNGEIKAELVASTDSPEKRFSELKGKVQVVSFAAMLQDPAVRAHLRISDSQFRILEDAFLSYKVSDIGIPESPVDIFDLDGNKVGSLPPAILFQVGSPVIFDTRSKRILPACFYGKPLILGL